jgi:dihydrofolate synthase/folylpolyglutamate synthase
MPKAYESIKKNLRVPKIIHFVGTNAKGTTGRFLASALYKKGYSVGHYTSPHILTFNERIWLNSKNVDDEKLNYAHNELLKILPQEFSKSLSYFEYTTLLALYIYQDVDYLILEAGLGGEHDATSVFENILTVVTPIDKDHESFLGSTIKEIATTKLKAIKTNAIIAKQHHKEVYEIATKLSRRYNFNIYKTTDFIDKNDINKIDEISKELSLVYYLEENLQTAISVLNYLNIPYDIDDFKDSRLFGRLTQIKENITLDVGHNTLGAKSILKSLDGKKYTLIYNSFKDKDYENILSILKPIVTDVEIIKIDDTRAESIQNIEKTLDKLDIKHKLFKNIQKEKNYLVFGSFSVVEAFLRYLDE